MDKTFHDRTSERPALSSYAGDRPCSPQGSAQDDPANFVTVCGWCPEVHILKIHRRETDTVIVLHYGKRLMILRNGIPLTISHGICVPCRDKHFPKKVQP
jgi:hypothetical protein